MAGSNDTSVVDLSNCDREPIHIPGAIQPHGVLLAVSLPALTIAQTSDNVTTQLGLGIRSVLGHSLADVIGSPSAREVADALATDAWKERNPLRVTVRGRPFDGIVHISDGVGVLELEPSDGHTNVAPALRPVLTAIQRARTLEALLGTAVHEIKRLTHFDRVIVYRFGEEGHGSVDAEARNAALEPYLGLHYPASDIPQQARALYLKSWLRIIPDGRYAPSQLVPALRPDTGTPLDLSLSVLRSVSAVHLEYMANMGVRGAMSASLIVRDRLWGLVSCASHGGPHFVPYEIRSVVEIIARFVSLEIDTLAERGWAALRAEARRRRDTLTARVRESRHEEDLFVPLLAACQEVLHLVGATGAAAVVGGDVRVCGLAPPPPVVRAIASFLDASAGENVFATAALPKLLPAAAEAKDAASGVLSFALPGHPSRRLIWFRPELIRTVIWGGDPHKAAEVEAGARLRPRHSFALWKEEVGLTSRPWTELEVDAAADLRTTLIEIDLARQVARAEGAVRARDDLLAIVSHDLKNPLGVVSLQSSWLRSAATKRSGNGMTARELASAEQIYRAAARMNALIRDLLDAATIDAGGLHVHPALAPILDVVEENVAMVRPLADAKHVAICEEVCDGGTMRVDRERVFQVLSNLLGNAIKFTPNGGAVTLRVERRDGDLVFMIADTGPGICSDDLAHVFDRHWRKSTTGREGAGLGLYIAKGVVEAHGGKIWVESTPGVGSRFFFSLPA